MMAKNPLTQVFYDHGSPCSFVSEGILQNAMAAGHLDLLLPSLISLCEEPFLSRDVNVTGCYLIDNFTGYFRMWAVRMFRDCDAKIKFGTIFSLMMLLS